MAYEMRISDWSSDVCSSDLQHLAHQRVDEGLLPRDPRQVAALFEAQPLSVPGPEVPDGLEPVEGLLAGGQLEAAVVRVLDQWLGQAHAHPAQRVHDLQDRKSVV